MNMMQDGKVHLKHILDLPKKTADGITLQLAQVYRIFNINCVESNNKMY